jgi:L-fuconolactonase
VNESPQSQAIIDAHHHLFPDGPAPYGPKEFAADLAGQGITASVYVESRAKLRQSGPSPLRPVGETEYAVEVSQRSEAGEFGPTQIASAIVAHADLREESVGDVFDAQTILGTSSHC